MWKKEDLTIPMNSDEEFFRSLHLAHPELRLNVPRTITEIDSLIPESSRVSSINDSDMRPEDSLLEKHFPYFMDIMIMRSSRYAPAFKHSPSREFYLTFSPMPFMRLNPKPTFILRPAMIL